MPRPPALPPEPAAITWQAARTFPASATAAHSRGSRGFSGGLLLFFSPPGAPPLLQKGGRGAFLGGGAPLSAPLAGRHAAQPQLPGHQGRARPLRLGGRRRGRRSWRGGRRRWPRRRPRKRRTISQPAVHLGPPWRGGRRRGGRGGRKAAVLAPGRVGVAALVGGEGAPGREGGEASPGVEIDAFLFFVPLVFAANRALRISPPSLVRNPLSSPCLPPY